MDLGSWDGISTMSIVFVSIGGVIAVLSLIILAATLMDIPNRRRRQDDKGTFSSEEMERDSIDFELLEKDIIEVTVTRMPSTSQSNPSQSIYAPRMPSIPVCEWFTRDRSATKPL
ncbi:hypothetical protein COCVIDRAFT_27964 [Bipolaris victoriae FI3]|uniref:Uncharacterized protein n=1 Tax=Bipolaris victoriae (strain FI3) TaxID=930091 RepID=W7E4W4_BIPV3|nr:hypothetical protein COCVIDRAFT_27964 [Bipolaris victoriae FI3]